ncbi:hypothetical protein PspKH34_22830 [Parageobacillus sp. KH3-4]|nr:hypothetical protein PspKH34_22830 [Parageobacillus sp. KH3-4]
MLRGQNMYLYWNWNTTSRILNGWMGLGSPSQKKNGLDNAPNGRQKAEEKFLQTAVVIIESFRNLNRCVQFLY